MPNTSVASVLLSMMPGRPAMIIMKTHHQIAVHPLGEVLKSANS